jgi:ABC-type multidrug transport system fused ATPase/permease subunit
LILIVTSLVFVILTNLFIPTSQQNNTNTFDNWLIWLENHSATVTAIGIIVTIFLFIIQQWLKHIEELHKSLNHKLDYIYSLLSESISRKDDFNRYKRSEDDICDLELTNEVYGKNPFHVELLVEERTGAIIRDYYDVLKTRNKLYSYRMEGKLSNLHDENYYVSEFIRSLDEKIRKEDEFLINVNDEVIALLEINLDIIKKNKKSFRTKIGLRFK